VLHHVTIVPSLLVTCHHYVLMTNSLKQRVYKDNPLLNITWNRITRDTISLTHRWKRPSGAFCYRLLSLSTS